MSQLHLRAEYHLLQWWSSTTGIKPHQCLACRFWWFSNLTGVFGAKCVCVFTSEDSVDRGVCGQPRLPTFMEDPSIGQILREEETPRGEQKQKTSNQTWTWEILVCGFLWFQFQLLAVQNLKLIQGAGIQVWYFFTFWAPLIVIDSVPVLRQERVQQLTHRGTKRPSEGADILALRGVLCLALSPLSLERRIRDGYTEEQTTSWVIISSWLCWKCEKHRKKMIMSHLRKSQDWCRLPPITVLLKERQVAGRSFSRQTNHVLNKLMTSFWKSVQS